MKSRFTPGHGREIFTLLYKIIHEPQGGNEFQPGHGTKMSARIVFLAGLTARTLYGAT